MFVIEDLPVAIIFCVITMLGWGSWANTQKISAKRNYAFPLYYWDYTIGVFLTGVVYLFLLGAPEEWGLHAFMNLAEAPGLVIGQAVLSGVLFNVSNLLLVVAIDAAGMVVAFPLGVGLALVIGTVASFILTPKGSPVLLASGVALVLVAMLMSALARRKLAAEPGESWTRGVVYALAAGCLMGFFYPRLVATISPEFHRQAIQPGYLMPYVALALFGAGVVLSNAVVNSIFMKLNGLGYPDYFSRGARDHWPGLAGGAIWMTALTANVLASGVAGPAISYALGQGATLVAAIWGVFIWKEFRGAPGVALPLGLMFACYAGGLLLIGTATLQ